MSIRCDVGGHSVLVVNVYAPHVDTEREAFFSALAARTPQHDGPVLIGGDFNCTNHPEIDRSYQATAATHCSVQLQRWIHKWHVEDALAPFFPGTEGRDEELDAFRAAQHTYRYTVNGRLASSRLDRWYVSVRVLDWIHTVHATDLGGGSDHAAVSLVLVDPAQSATVKAQAKVYPPKAGAVDAVNDLVDEALHLLAEDYRRLDEDAAPAERYLETWEKFKVQVVIDIKRTAKAAIAKINASYKTRVARIRRRIRETVAA